MMITLHGDRGKRKAESKAQKRPLHHPLCSSSLRCLRRSGYEGSLLPNSLLMFLYTVHARAQHIAGHRPSGVLELYAHEAGGGLPSTGSGAAKAKGKSERASEETEGA